MNENDEFPRDALKHKKHIVIIRCSVLSPPMEGKMKPTKIH